MPCPEQVAFLIGVGSNIKPEMNCTRVVKALLLQFGRISLSSVVRTEPEGINTPNKFINLMVYLQTDWSIVQLKAWSNALETDLGRDRSHPNRKSIDRPADIDILQQLPAGGIFDPLQVKEQYFQEISHELANHLGGQNGQRVRLVCCPLRLNENSEVGNRAATIDLDRASGDIRIIQ